MAQQTTMTTRLLARREVAERTAAFELEKPPGFSFKAGQALDLQLIDPLENDAEGDKRSFSITSAPSAPTLEVATRLRDTAFKRVLSRLPAGAALRLDGPFGELTLPEDAAKPVVLVAGGIGITPFMSMVREAALRAARRTLVLVCCDRRPEDIPFREELESLPGRLPGLRCLLTLTRAENSRRPWHGRRGRVTAEWLKHEVPEIRAGVCLAAGSPAFVTAMRQALLAAGASNEAVLTEDFTGY